MGRTPVRHRKWQFRLVVSALLVSLTIAATSLVSGEGSGTLYRVPGLAGFRSHLEWRTSDYGGGDSPDFVLRRRTLLKLYARAGESILLGSSGIAVGGPPDSGDIRVFNPGQVTGDIGQEAIPALAGTPTNGVYANGFSCVEQRAAFPSRGRIANATEEEAGPLPNTGGYDPCVYVAPATGIYDVVFTGPSGDRSDDEPQVSGELIPPPADFGPSQRTSVTAWDVTVRDTTGTTFPGRLFSYYYTANTGGGGRDVAGAGVVVTDTGFRYSILFAGDPFGFVLYANQLGFQDSDGTPLYRNLLADPSASFQNQNQLREIQGGASLLRPEFPIFLTEPDPLVLDALEIPRLPVAPAISGLAFQGPDGGPSTGVNLGGAFTFETTQPGVFYIVISRDGTNFDPTNPANRVLRGVAEAGPVTVTWDGRDNQGQPFPAGDFVAGAAIQGGEVHFPLLDVENNVRGGPRIELLNPPDRTGDGQPDCPPWNGGCFGAFYDDRGYRTADGTLVGTAVNGPLCPGNVGNPPAIPSSDPLLGFDSRTAQRAFGFPFDANPASVCLPNGGFGDKKGLDFWTFYPSNVLTTPIQIVPPTAVTLRSLTAARVGDTVVVAWETGVELGTRGFHILRSPTGALADAERVTGALIPARGGASEGAAYRWVDRGAADLQGEAAYWLEEHELGGGTNLYGPARPAPAPAGGPGTIYLPLITR